MKTSTRRHFLSLAPGDRFRYLERGPVYRRGLDSGKKGDERATVERLEGRAWVPAGTQDYTGCFVIPIDSEEDD